MNNQTKIVFEGPVGPIVRLKRRVRTAFAWRRVHANSDDGFRYYINGVTGDRFARFVGPAKGGPSKMFWLMHGEGAATIRGINGKRVVLK